MHPAVLDLRFPVRNVIHARNTPSSCAAAVASSMISFSVHFFLLALSIVDLCSFLGGVACGNLIAADSPARRTGD
ncbi:hypothetical protein B5K08_17845 [Rhizobium leguminosarum bv. trifolii]|uniref:Uncharacterized protein n=1 Tax=Rhizobium leguminosarum bv. trifolii TaxID=386 RepID=A0A3E1BFL1_RHILT|nr:hypothetical protein B5K08_17845 [Rhizobium leguminosarum bv. trifolii]RFB91173.1 hypothetical protein B5K10_17840 [Rhizobium leguminosarum bv. trifolii]